MASGKGKLAKRYAKALFELCDISNMEDVAQGLGLLGKCWHENVELKSLLRNPAVPERERKAVALDLAARVRPSDHNFANFLQLLIENDRFGYLPEIAQEFAASVAQLKKSLALEVVSAFVLPSDERGSLETRIKGEFGAMASISWSVDPSILGGLLIKAGDKLLDGSVGGSLERIRAELIA